MSPRLTISMRDNIGAIWRWLECSVFLQSASAFKRDSQHNRAYCVLSAFWAVAASLECTIVGWYIKCVLTWAPRGSKPNQITSGLGLVRYHLWATQVRFVRKRQRCHSKSGVGWELCSRILSRQLARLWLTLEEWRATSSTKFSRGRVACSARSSVNCGQEHMEVWKILRLRASDHLRNLCTLIIISRSQ